MKREFSQLRWGESAMGFAALRLRTLILGSNVAEFFLGRHHGRSYRRGQMPGV